jgi:pimeloyl-ACP methyl ester carboxylesterase
MASAPILDNLAPLAKATVPILHVCGSLDPALEDNTRLAQKRYAELGGVLGLILENGKGHFLQPADSKAVVDFIMKSSAAAQR